MEELQQAAFGIISIVGEAKIHYMNAIKLARSGEKEKAKEEITAGNQILAKAHHEHFDVIQKEAEGEKVEYSVLFMHAEDQLLTAEVFRDMAVELLAVYEELNQLKGV